MKTNLKGRNQDKVSCRITLSVEEAYFLSLQTGSASLTKGVKLMLGSYIQVLRERHEMRDVTLTDALIHLEDIGWIHRTSDIPEVVEARLDSFEERVNKL